MADDRFTASAFEATQRLAYAIYEHRGGGNAGHELEDWVAAEGKLRELANVATLIETVGCETVSTDPKRKVGFAGPA